MHELCRRLSIAACALLLAARAGAQEAPAAPSGASTEKPAKEAEAPEDDDPMGTILLGLKVGYFLYAESSEINAPMAAIPGAPTVKTHIGARENVQLTLPLNIGGSGLGLDVQPGIGFGDWTNVNLYAGLALHIGFGDLYFDVAGGPQLGYAIEDGVDVGIDIFLRVPLGLTYYVSPDVGLFAELGLLWGATGFKPTPAPGTTVDLQFGVLTALEAAIGFRYP